MGGGGGGGYFLEQPACFQDSVSCRYDFNHTKSGVVTFAEWKPIHSRSMTEHEWILRNDVVNQLKEY